MKGMKQRHKEASRLERSKILMEGRERGKEARRVEGLSMAGPALGEVVSQPALRVILNYRPDIFRLYLFFDLLCCTLNMSN